MNYLLLMAFLLFLSGCIVSTEVQPSKVEVVTVSHLTKEAEENDVKALDGAKTLLNMPYGTGREGVSFDYLPKPTIGKAPLIDEYNQVREMVGNMAGPKTIQYLLDTIVNNVNREDALAYCFLGGTMISHRSFMALISVKDKESVYLILRELLDKDVDPYLKKDLMCLLYEVPMGSRTGSLPLNYRLDLLGKMLNDEREARPKEWDTKISKGTNHAKRNRVCDFAYDMIRITYDKRYSPISEDKLKDRIYNKKLSMLRKWYRNNRDKIRIGEQVLLPDFRDLQPSLAKEHTLQE